MKLKLCFLILSSITSFSQNAINGAKLFDLNCSACHNFKVDGIGPHLGGLNGTVNLTYLTDMINNPQALIDSKEPRALKKFQQYKSVMPSFKHLDPQEIQDIVSYILTKPAPVVKNKSGLKILDNPIPKPITKGSLSINITKVAQFPHTRDTEPRARLNKMLVHPISKQSMVSDLQGFIYTLDKDFKQTVFFEAKPYFKNFVNAPGLAVGLGSFAFHPDFATNKLFYTTHTESPTGITADFAYADTIPIKMQWVLNEWKLEDINAQVLNGTPRELMRINVVNQIHGLQEIVFNPYANSGSIDYGLMYMGLGDGGCVEEGYGFLAKSKNSVWGKVLRIDPLGQNSANGKYGIPFSNPFVNKDGIDEAFAIGFRNPNRISWTAKGKMLVSNIGQKQIESLYLLEAGKNYGWPDREGGFMIDPKATINTVIPLPSNDASLRYTYPIAQYDHDEGNAIMGGFEYTGSKIPALKGKYIFGEVVQGRVFYINVNEIKQGSLAVIHEFPILLDGKNVNLKELTKSNKVDLRIGKDADNEMYIMTKPDGVMYKIIP